MNKLSVILATQRSGTNMLRSVLNSHPRLVALPEVFHVINGPLEDYGNPIPGFDGLSYYQTYYKDLVTGSPELLYPKRRKECVCTYFETIKVAAKKADKTPVIDVKYNSLHHADMAWRNPIAPPEMLDVFHGMKCPVIHLRRRNHVALAVSQIRSVKTKQFRVEDGEGIQRPLLHIEPSTLLDFLDMEQRLEEQICRWIEEFDFPVLELIYEDLFVGEPGSNLNAEVFSKIGEFLQTDPAGFDLQPTTKKQGGIPPHEEISNFDELEKALRGTRHYDSLLGCSSVIKNSL